MTKNEKNEFQQVPAEENAETQKVIFLREMGQRIKKVRQKTGLTQEEFADKYEYNRTLIAKLEAGLRDIKSSELLKLSRELGVSADYLLGKTKITSAKPNVQAVLNDTGLTQDSIDYCRKAVDDEYSNAKFGESPWKKDDNYYGLRAVNVMLSSKEGREFIEAIGHSLVQKSEESIYEFSDVCAFWVQGRFFRLFEKLRGKEFDNIFKE